jgi:hypothetical protein
MHYQELFLIFPPNLRAFFSFLEEIFQFITPCTIAFDFKEKLISQIQAHDRIVLNEEKYKKT